MTPSVSAGMADGSAGIVIVNWQVEQNGIIALEAPDVVVRGAQVLDERGLCRLCVVAFGKGLLEAEDVPAQLELRLDLAPQRVERLDLVRRQRAGDAIDHTQRAERVAIGRDQRRAGVEADVRIAGDERIVAQPRIGAGVRDDEEVVLLDRMGAERNRPRRFATA